jgi:hypothetical protein
MKSAIATGSMIIRGAQNTGSGSFSRGCSHRSAALHLLRSDHNLIPTLQGHPPRSIYNLQGRWSSFALPSHLFIIRKEAQARQIIIWDQPRLAVIFPGPKRSEDLVVTIQEFRSLICFRIPTIDHPSDPFCFAWVTSTSCTRATRPSTTATAKHGSILLQFRPKIGCKPSRQCSNN